MYGRCMSSDYRTTDILELDSKEDIDISKLTMRKMKPVTKSSRPCFTMSLFLTNFAFSDMQIKKVFNWAGKKLFIKKEKLKLNENICSTLLHLFVRV